LKRAAAVNEFRNASIDRRKILDRNLFLPKLSVSNFGWIILIFNIKQLIRIHNE